MKYTIIGAGGCGGSIAAYLQKAGKDVTVIARGKHLEKIRQYGIKMETPHLGTFVAQGIKAMEMEQYQDTMETAFVCVKGYSVDSIIPFLKQHVDENSIIIPILNIYGTGSKLQQKLPNCTVLDGCIYVAAEIKEPGCIWQKGDIFRIVYGPRKDQEFTKELFEIKKDLEDAHITPALTENVARDTFQKYAYVSPMAACGLYFDKSAEAFQKAGEERLMAENCMKEIDALAAAMGIPFLVDIVKTNMDILDALSPQASTSMQRDIWAGKESEIDGLVFEPVRLGRKYNVPMPCYTKIAEKFGFVE